MEPGRLELRHGGAEGMLATALKVCLSMKAVFIFILLLSLGYECALKRYAGLSITTDNGKTTLQLSVHPKGGEDENDPSSLTKLFKFSFSFSDEVSQETTNDALVKSREEVDEKERVRVTQGDEPGQLEGEAKVVDKHGEEVDEREHETKGTGQEVDGENDQKTPGEQGTEQVDDENDQKTPGEQGTEQVDDENDSEPEEASGEREAKGTEQVDDETVSELEETPGDADVKEEKLPALRIKYVGNQSLVGDATPADDPFRALVSTKPVRRDLNRSSESSATLLLVLILLLGVLLLAFLLLCFNQSAITAVVGYSVACAYMRKPVRVMKALASGLKVGILRLMWLSVLYEMVRETHSLVLSWLLLRNAEDVESLVLRLSTMPFALTAPFRDETIRQLGISRQVGIYLTSEYVFQGLAFTVFIVACWVTIFERNYRGVLAFRRSWNLIRSMPWLALGFKVAGSLVCGRSFKWMLEKAFGWYSAVLLVSAAEIYMVIAWLVFYFSARSKLEPRFSHQDLEDFLSTVR